MNSNSELKTRVTTAVFGGSIFLAMVTVGGHIGTAIVAAFISLMCLYEFLQLVLHLSDRSEKRSVVLGLAWLVGFANVFIPRGEYEEFLICFLILFIYFLLTSPRHMGEAFKQHLHELFYSIFGLLYLGFLPLYFPLIRDSANGLHWVILFLAINWVGDSAAYFGGKRFGKNKLFPTISPKKTWEGSLSGLLGPIVFALIYKLIFFKGLSFASVIIVPVIVGILAQCGDLCESYIKRAYNVKDSGTLLPGHGGFLDRFDGFLFSLPAMYACVRIFS